MGTTDPVAVVTQVYVVGPLPSSEGYKYAVTGVDTATGLLAAYPLGTQIRKQ